MLKLHIIDISKNATTGLITGEFRIIDQDQDNPAASTVTGVVERWQIDALEISTKYDGQVELWLRYAAREMLGRHRRRVAVHDDIHKWHGQHMDITDIKV